MSLLGKRTVVISLLLSFLASFIVPVVHAQSIASFVSLQVNSCIIGTDMSTGYADECEIMIQGSVDYVYLENYDFQLSTTRADLYDMFGYIPTQNIDLSKSYYEWIAFNGQYQEIVLWFRPETTSEGGPGFRGWTYG